MARTTLFLDDGGVLSDNTVRSAEWQRLCGEFFAERLGGEPRAWGEANRVMFPPIFDAYLQVMAIPDRYLEGERAYERAWLTAMCEYMGVTPPPGEECPALAREAMVYITSRVEGAYPGPARRSGRSPAPATPSTPPRTRPPGRWRATSGRWGSWGASASSSAPI